MNVLPNFNRKDWIPGFAADLLNARSGIPFVWVARPDIAEEYGARGTHRADEEFAKFFGACVNRWISSGRDSKGVDEPLTRKLDDSLFEVLGEWIGRNAFKPGLSRSGKISVLEMPPIFPRLEPAVFAREHALYWFAQLLNSPGAERLARCSNPKCASYFVRLRTRAKEGTRGSYCRKCAGVASMVRTQATRDKRMQILVGFAADCWNQWESSPRRTKKADWVAKEINKKLRTDMRITAKWVSRNTAAIENEVKRRKDAKG